MQPALASLEKRTFLLGVGAQKAGTSWLYYYFDSHPEVFMSPIKELHFFGNRQGPEKWPMPMFRKKLRQRRQNEAGTANPKRHTALRERIRMGSDTQLYRRFFRKRISNEPVFGEITPAYSKLDVAELEFIRAQFPQTKIIFLMRNPTDRLWSQMRFSEDFERLEELEARIGGILDQPAYSTRGDYTRTLGNLAAVFPPEMVHFEFYEHLFSEAAIGRLCTFLNIENRPADFDVERNVSPKYPLSRKQRKKLVKLLRPQYDAVISQFGKNVPQSWRDDLRTVDKKLKR